MGDFNFDISNHDTLNQEFLHILLEHGYCPGFCNITRPSDKTCNSGTCIDNIFIKLDNIAYKTFTLRIPLTDHYPLFMSINKLRTIQKIHTVNRINYNKLRTTAVNINWNEISQINDPNIAINILIDKIKTCLSKAEYTEKTNKTNNMKPRKDWITMAIMKSCNTKEKLYKIWKKDPNNTRKREEYRKFTNILKNIINKAKELYDKKQIENSMNNSKSIWNLINQKIGKNRKKNNNINNIIDNNKKITDHQKIADHLKKFFCNVGKKLSDKIRPLNNEKIKLPTMNSKSIFFEPSNHQEIVHIICNMENKNGGNDNINAKTLKTLVEHLIDPLTHIFNLCITKAIWPDALKSADMIPINKSKEKHIATN